MLNKSEHSKKKKRGNDDIINKILKKRPNRLVSLIHFIYEHA